MTLYNWACFLFLTVVLGKEYGLNPVLARALLTLFWAVMVVLLILSLASRHA